MTTDLRYPDPQGFTDDLTRMTQRIPTLGPESGVEARQDDPALHNTMVGYATVFNEWTKIRSLWEGEFWERIAPGSFRKTLTERFDAIKVQFDHGFDMAFGNLPLGKPTVIEETDAGLWTETPLSQARSVQDEIKPRLREGSLDGMSFQFSVVRDEWHDPAEEGRAEDGLPDDGLKRRTIKEVKLYEFGPVTYPAYEATTVGIRSAHEYQRWLRERATLGTNGAAETGTPLVEPPRLALTQQERKRRYRAAVVLLRKGTN